MQALLSEDILCLGVKSKSSDSYIGLFDVCGEPPDVLHEARR